MRAIPLTMATPDLAMLPLNQIVDVRLIYHKEFTIFYRSFLASRCKLLARSHAYHGEKYQVKLSHHLKFLPIVKKKRSLSLIGRM